MSKKAVFFDRDGTLNVDMDYLYKLEELRWMPHAREALAFLSQRGYLLFVITNQSGIARGYYTIEQMQELHHQMTLEAAAYGAKLEKFYYCPHHKEGKIKEYAIDCDCRKPKPGMLLQCFKEYDIDISQSFFVGDSKRDVECAQAVGMKGYLYQGGSLRDFVIGALKDN